MKKFGALFITSFYLLLTIGVYGCWLHCTVGYVISEFTGQTALHVDHDNDAADNDDDCKSGECTCCYHHGTYVVNENIHSGSGYQATLVQPALIPIWYEHSVYVLDTIKPSISWPKSTGPPFLFTQPIYITNKTFLI